MIKIQIENEERVGIDSGWINQQINRRRQENRSVCVIVTIDEGNIGITLRSPGCLSLRGVGGQLNTDEQAIEQLWRKEGMNRPDFRGEDLINFLRHLKRVA
jgi:hypothetical protein